MAAWDEIADGLTGAWLLANRDLAGYGCFNQTADGFWRSFMAIPLVAPLYLYAVTAEADLAAATGSDSAEPAGETGAGFYVVNSLALVLEWAVYPLVLALLANTIGIARRYAVYIIAYNWSSVLVMAAFVPPVLLFDLGILGVGGALLLNFVVMLAALYYRWYVARTALETTGAVAAGLVVGDLILSVSVNRLIT